MPHLVWTNNALRDLRRLHDFLSPKSPDAAKRAAKAIRQSAKVLAKQPEIGRPIEEMLLGFRELVIDFGQSAYVALYHFDGEQVLLLAIRHGREAGY
jgi:plasmid stabilization system protein ParE